MKLILKIIGLLLITQVKLEHGMELTSIILQEDALLETGFEQFTVSKYHIQYFPEYSPG